MGDLGGFVWWNDNRKYYTGNCTITNRAGQTHSVGLFRCFYFFQAPATKCLLRNTHHIETIILARCVVASLASILSNTCFLREGDLYGRCVCTKCIYIPTYTHFPFPFYYSLLGKEHERNETFPIYHHFATTTNPPHYSPHPPPRSYPICMLSVYPSDGNCRKLCWSGVLKHFLLSECVCVCVWCSAKCTFLVVLSTHT